MKDNLDDFLDEQKETFKVDHERVMKRWEKEEKAKAKLGKKVKKPKLSGGNSG
jgi:hypothetical protein